MQRYFRDILQYMRYWWRQWWFLREYTVLTSSDFLDTDTYGENLLMSNSVICTIHGAVLLPASESIALPPSLIMPAGIFRELFYYFSHLPAEMQVMGFVEQETGNRFVVKEIVIPPHEAGIAHADLDQDEFPAWLDRLEKQGGDLKKLRLQMHSHGSLPAYFSSTDIHTIAEAYSCDWMISVVGNMQGNFVARLDVFSPIPLSIALPIIIEYPQVVYTNEEDMFWNARLTEGRNNPMQKMKKEESHDTVF